MNCFTSIHFRMKNPKTLQLLCLGLFTVWLGNCGAPLDGVASFTLATREQPKFTKIEKIGPVVTDSVCNHTAAIFLFWGDAGIANHEQLVQKILEEKKADLLLDAELTETMNWIPFLYAKACLQITGQPAKILD